MQRVSAIISRQGPGMVNMRKHSKTVIKAMNKHPVRVKRNAKILASKGPQESVDLSLKYEPTFTPEFVSHTGWSPAPPAPIEGLPFNVYRTTLGQQLPVYTDYRKGRTQQRTILRKYEGATEELTAEFSKVCGGEPVTVKLGSLEVKGNHVKATKTWLTGLGF